MFDIQENLKKLPDTPGVYMHKDKLGQVIYVGKAISLKNRVRQYFQSSYQSTSAKVKTMVSHIAEFEYITCASEMEALILECNLIKKYMPKYNVLLRDDKTYPYIMVTTSEEFPRIVKTRSIKKDGNRYFGPYSDVGAVNKIVDLLSSMYSLKKCSATDFSGNHRPCLNYHIETCRGVCTGKVDKAEYAQAVDQILQFLSGKTNKLIASLESKMYEASEKMEFELAARYRDQIEAFNALDETQRVTFTNGKDLDMVLAVHEGGEAFVVLFNVRDGKLTGRENFQIQADSEDSKALMVSEFIRQYYSQWAKVPQEILIEEEIPDLDLTEDFLSRDGQKVNVSVPKRGYRRDLINLAKNDVNEMRKTLGQKAEVRLERQQSVYNEMESLMKEGGFKRRSERIGKPYRVESYDISNTNGVDSVGAMVVFEGLEKVRKDYRRFKIRTVEGPDDYASLQEVLYRRYKRALEGDSSFVNLPDIIMMDGGLGQVSSAYEVLDALGVNIPVVGMAKDDSHRTRAIVFRDGHEIELKNHSTLFHYAGTIQEEVHRFAIDYHHNLHMKNAMKSVFDYIEGVGPKRRNELLHHFKTMDAIKAASVEELMEVDCIPEWVAKNIREYFD